MDEEHTRLIRIFYSYAHKDIDMRKELATHLGNRYISWHDRDIAPGMDWAREIDEHLNSADIILLLISADFMNSDYCNGIEMKRALERRANGEAEVIPIMLRSVHWEDPPFKDLQFLPTDRKPVTSWLDHDVPFTNVAKGVSKTANRLLEKRKNVEIKNQSIVKAEQYVAAGEHKAALNVYDEVLRLFPEDPSLYKSKGDSLLAMAQSERNELVEMYLKKAAGAFEQAIKWSFGRDAELYTRKGDVLAMLALYQRALDEYEKAQALTPEIASLYERKGRMLYKLKKYSEAVEAYQQAIGRDPGNAQLWRNKAVALGEDGRFREAYGAYEEAIKCNLDNAVFHKEKGDMLVKLNDLPGALTAYTDAINLNRSFGFAYLSRGRVYEKMAQDDREIAKRLGISEENM